jgi:cytoskeletal protein CcmA (bactofilin family)
MRTRRTLRIWPVASATILLVLAALTVVSPVQAADVRSGDYVTVAANETIEDNLYAAASTVNMNGTVKGDVIAVGGDITIDGTVDGSVLATGRSVVINGIINGSVRIAGQVMVLGPKARIARDVAAVGYSLEQQTGSSVGRDVLVFGYQALMADSVGRDIKGAMGGLELRGRVVRDVNVKVGDTGNVDAWAWAAAPVASVPVVQPGLTLAEGSRVAGKLIYESGTRGKINPAQVGEKVEWRERTNQVGQGSRSAGAMVTGWVQRFAMLLLVGLLLVWVAPRWTQRLADNIQARPAAGLGWGAFALVVFGLLVVAIVVLVVILAIVFSILTLTPLAVFVAGLGLAGEVVLITGFLFFVSFVVQVLLSFAVGRWLLARLRPQWASGRVLPLVAGLALFVVLTSVPLLGGLIGLATLLLGLGALWLWLLTGRQRYEGARPGERGAAGDQGPAVAPGL